MQTFLIAYLLSAAVYIASALFVIGPRGSGVWRRVLRKFRGDKVNCNHDIASVGYGDCLETDATATVVTKSSNCHTWKLAISSVFVADRLAFGGWNPLSGSGNVTLSQLFYGLNGMSSRDFDEARQYSRKTCRNDSADSAGCA